VWHRTKLIKGKQKTQWIHPIHRELKLLNSIMMELKLRKKSTQKSPTEIFPSGLNYEITPQGCG